MAASSASPMSLKLVIDTEGKRVLFAEADKDFVDFLFHLLTLPVAKLISLVGGPQQAAMVGSLSNVYGGLQNLGEPYVHSAPNKNHVLNPAATAVSIPLLGIKYINPTSQQKFYLCHSNRGYQCNLCNFTDDPSGMCPVCHYQSTRVLNYVAPSNSVNREGGVVIGTVKYLVWDDLAVMPMTTFSTSSCVAMMKAFHDVKNVDAFQEKVVHLGMDEAVKLVRAAMQNKNVLTTVFLSP